MTKSAAIFLLFAPSSYAISQASDTRRPEFEIASVKPIDLKGRNSPDIKILPGGRMIDTAASFQQLVAGRTADLSCIRLSVPRGVADTRFNIEAKPPENDFDQQPTVTALGRQVPQKTMLRLR